LRHEETETVLQAESALGILWVERHSQGHIASRDSSSLPGCLDTSEADVILQLSDHVNFRVHKLILVSSSQFFKEMFSLPQPPDGEVMDGLPVVHVSEDAELM
jgi:4-hydroxyphenylpyruvate dioxygenase-like putative hemolysin